MHFPPRIHSPTNTSPAYASPPAPNPHVLSPRSTSYHDSETGFTFSETRAAATLTSNVIYRIAQPANVAPNTPYDIVLQVVAPSTLGWVGLAWGGGMVRNPLTVGYPNGAKTPTVSSRWATYVEFSSSSSSSIPLFTLFPFSSPYPQRLLQKKSPKLANQVFSISFYIDPTQHPHLIPLQHWFPSAQATSQTRHTGNSPSNAPAVHPTRALQVPW